MYSEKVFEADKIFCLKESRLGLGCFNPSLHKFTFIHYKPIVSCKENVIERSSEKKDGDYNYVELDKKINLLKSASIQVIPIKIPERGRTRG